MLTEYATKIYPKEEDEHKVDQIMDVLYLIL